MYLHIYAGRAVTNNYYIFNFTRLISRLLLVVENLLKNIKAE